MGENYFKLILFGGLILVVLGILFVVGASRNGDLRIIFCDVGQGDGVLVITPRGKQMLIDGGSGANISKCIASYMPFWDRNLEFMVATHPQKDHIESQIRIFEEFNVERVIFTGVGAEAAFYDEWQNKLKLEQAQVIDAVAGKKILTENVEISLLWPREEDLSLWESSGIEDLNDTSVVLKVEMGDFCAFMTGDAPYEILESIVDGECEVLKVSHHGSKTGTTDELLGRLNPKIAVVQSGKNSYGHPHPDVLGMLERSGSKVLRNDKEGDIEVVVRDGQISIR